jgi:hypothetical protein
MNKKSKIEKRVDIAHRALDALALALVGHGHKWTKEERSLYEKAARAFSV